MRLHDLTLYLVRHGECRHNVEGRVAGRSDTPLTARGREQARDNGVLLAEAEPDLARFAFFASPLHRAANTMEIVREAAGLPRDEYVADYRLSELDCGANTFRVWAEIERDMKADPSYTDRWHWRHPGGESLADVHERVGRFLAGLTGDAVIVSHAGPVRMLRAYYLGLAPEAVLDYKPMHTGIVRLSAGGEAHFGE
ncbi:MAG TPA: histidine phosphatase family protein [Rhizomicrobium sp.]|jgi:probable phosphoglycerate mutase